MGDDTHQWNLHHKIEAAVPGAPERIGYAELQTLVEVKQRGRVKRAVSTLVGFGVLDWAGQRNGRAVTQGAATLDEVLGAGLTPMPDREIQTYPLLSAPLDTFITTWHTDRQDPIDNSGHDSAVDDGVTVYNTSSTRAGVGGASSAYTRPDLTVIVDLHYDHFGDWNDVHAVEVKPYWAVTRAALFEAAAQAAMRRCTFSWLLVWVPDPDTGHFTAPQIASIGAAADALDALKVEAQDLGLGLLVAGDLSEDAALVCHAEPRRQAMEPAAADELFASLDRTDGRREGW